MDCALGLIFLMYVLQLDIDPGSALKCYYCHASEGDFYTCEHKPTPTQVASVRCSGDDDVCLTLKVDAHNVWRECATHDYCTTAFKNTTGRISCLICNSHLCNSGFVTPYWTFLLIFAPMYSVIKNLL